ncbi:MAG TPA: DUF1361 domain-containing protein [Bacteroidia bacterium]|nr:DUF1361 domain-containing protein [Bacteroidia bacterium]
MSHLLLHKYASTGIKKVILFSALFSLLLILFRIYFTSGLYLSFLLWNLFLAWLPYYFSNHLLQYFQQGKATWKLVLLFSLWLLFFPNSPYIITDLFHLTNHGEMPLWYDLAIIFSIAWSGLILGFLSLMQVHYFLIQKFGEFKSWLQIACIQLLCAYGIYLGRYERFNSWDILTQPFSLFNEILDLFCNPRSHPKTIGVTAVFSVVLMLSYLTLYFISHHPQHEEQ